MNKILIIEDDKIISKSIANHLTKWDFVVEKIKDFKNIMEEFIEFDPHLKKLWRKLSFLDFLSIANCDTMWYNILEERRDFYEYNYS